MSTSVRLPPGPQGLPWVGSLADLINRPMSFYRSMTLDYGDVSHTTVGPMQLYMINEPGLIDELLNGHAKSCMKDATTRAVYPLVGQGLLTSEGELWKRQRKLAAPAFSPKRVNAYADTMVELSERAFSRYIDGEKRDFHVDIMSLTLEIVGKTLLGVSTDDEAARVAAAVEATLSYLQERLGSWLSLLPPRFPTPKRRRSLQAKLELDRIVSGIIERCRREDPDADYLLARLIRARTEDGQAMSEQQLLDEAVTMLLAGHETTALTLMYSVYLLSKNPAVAAKLQAELDTQLQGRPVTAAALTNLPYLDAVVRESMRLYPPAYAFGREVIEPFELGGYVMPVGAQVVVSPYGMQRNPRFFPQPERFMPERWLDGAARALPRFAYFPFGGGHRICIGSHFAQLEASLVLATLVQQLELHVLPDFKLKLRPVITLRSQNGLPVRVRRRASVAITAEAEPAQTPETEGAALLAAAEAAGCPHAAAVRGAHPA